MSDNLLIEHKPTCAGNKGLPCNCGALPSAQSEPLLAACMKLTEHPDWGSDNPFGSARPDFREKYVKIHAHAWHEFLVAVRNAANNRVSGPQPAQETL
jgi:hypothetical protein